MSKAFRWCAAGLAILHLVFAGRLAPDVVEEFHLAGMARNVELRGVDWPHDWATATMAAGFTALPLLIAVMCGLAALRPPTSAVARWIVLCLSLATTLGFGALLCFMTSLG